MTTTDARKRLTAARAALVLDQSFWGALALRLELVEDTDHPTAWVDGAQLGYNPEFVTGLPWSHLVALVAHEVAHCALGHPWRQDGRTNAGWNQATDRAVNPILRDSGFTLPDGALFELDPSHVGKSAEWIYARLPTQETKQPGGGNGQGQTGTPGVEDTLGEVRSASTQADKDNAPTEQEWKQATQQAAHATQCRGKFPWGAAQLVKQAKTTRTDWRSALRRFAQEVARTDYTWARPNPRYMARGLYLPALRSTEMGPLVVAIDTSGSIDATLRAAFGEEIRAMTDELQPRRTHLVYADTKIQSAQVFERGDTIEFKPVGGGGTDFRPVFDKYLAELDEPAACVVYLTDLHGRFPEDPGLPVLWATPTEHTQVAPPFGEVVWVDA